MGFSYLFKVLIFFFFLIFRALYAPSDGEPSPCGYDKRREATHQCNIIFCFLVSVEKAFSLNGLIIITNVQFDVTFPALQCSIISIDTMDISGERHLDVVCLDLFFYSYLYGFF